MTSAPPFTPEKTNQDEPPFWRDLLTTTLSYMEWGYGALLLSFVAYGVYVGSKVSREWSFCIDVLELLALACAVWQWRQLKQRVDAYEALSSLNTFGVGAQSRDAILPDPQFCNKSGIKETGHTSGFKGVARFELEGCS